ncbi:Flavohemoprotein (Hemoglobin-like protein) (Flavohemoglobin) (Nitric oxide dioxygenase) [Klebsiella pneumoniae]|nr:Flavohemoprotein (Hemoglobin-like protein) (Flavohemoglobin) (Nitric oxide dioxygenase) [Klebsiella pneumoniae]
MPGGKAYGVLANVFIGREAEIYQQNASKTGRLGRDPRVSHRERKPRAASLSPALSSNRLMQPVADYQPGQYLAIWLKPGRLRISGNPPVHP